MCLVSFDTGTLVTDRNAVIAITYRAIAGFFAPQGPHVSPTIAKFWQAEGCQISCRSLHIEGFLTPKHQKF